MRQNSLRRDRHGHDSLRPRIARRSRSPASLASLARPGFILLSAWLISLGLASPAGAGLGHLEEVVENYEEIQEEGSSDAASTDGEVAIDLSAGGEEEAIDLSGPPEGGGGPPGGSSSYGRPSAGSPTFKVYFDMLFYARPGVNPLTFDSFHNFLFFEIAPTPDISFTFDVSSSPKFFELDYKLTKRLTLRLGKIYIPFDDLIPHNIFGGRVNVSQLAPGAAFLPDIFTDLGFALKYRLFDSPNLAMDLHAYAVNGFRDGGTDLKDPSATAADYPSFSDLPIAADNNRDKGLGGRVNATLWGWWGIGASFYTARWSSESRAAHRLNLVGFDTQLRFRTTRLRIGVATTSVDLPGRSFLNGGSYVELGQRFGGRNQFMALLRGGTIQIDDAVISPSDQKIAGAALLYNPGMIQFSIEHSRDFEVVPTKENYTYTALRVSVAL